MTADEIRAHGPNEHGAEKPHNRDEYYWLREIAAQLAELNERLKLATLTAYVPDYRDQEPWTDSKTTAEMRNSIAGR